MDFRRAAGRMQCSKSLRCSAPIPLNLNWEFVDGRDLVIVPHDRDAIVEKILWYRDHPIELKNVAENGRREAICVFRYQN